MIYLLILVFAVWNGYVIRWQQKNNKADSKTWHTVGFWARIGILASALMFYLPEWTWYIVNPAFLFDGWYGIVLTVSTSFICSYWLYNMIINKINGWKLKYLGKGKHGGWTYIISGLLLAVLTIMFAIIAVVMKYY